jgi:hypothetical protein
MQRDRPVMWITDIPSFGLKALLCDYSVIISKWFPWRIKILRWFRPTGFTFVDVCAA